MSEPISYQCPKCGRSVGDPKGEICAECREFDRAQSDVMGDADQDPYWNDSMDDIGNK